jgi:arylsulfatase
MLFTIDSLRADALAGVELPGPLGPQGCHFRQAFTQAPYTWGAFATLFTSAYPAQVTMPNGVLLDSLPTLAEILQATGYYTVGLSSNPFLSVPFGYGRGFRRFEDWLLGLRGSKFWWRLYPLLSKVRRFVVDSAYPPAEALTKRAIAAIQQTPFPFFLWIHYMDPHGPYQPKGNNAWLNKLQAERLWRKTQNPDSILPQDREALLRAYREEVLYVLQNVNHLINSISELGNLNHTMIVLCSDHGDAFGEHGTYSHPRQLYDELIHVPLIFWHPDLPAREIDHPIGLIDIMPTILDMLGFDLTRYDFRGHSLLRLMETGDASYLPDYVVSDGKPDKPETLVSIRTAKWKLIVDEAKGGKELYDLEKDPGEQVNVISQHPKVVQELEAKLWAELSKEQITAVEAEQQVPEWDAAEEEEVLRRLEALGYVDWVEKHKQRQARSE